MEEKVQNKGRLKKRERGNNTEKEKCNKKEQKGNERRGGMIKDKGKEEK